MNHSRRPVWWVGALLAGFVYLVIGRAFAAPVHDVRVWRLAAWAVSGVVFALHVSYEHFGEPVTPRTVAVHAALAAALGAFGLAATAMVHSIPAEHAIRPVWLLALVLWPAITGVPAYIVALAAALVLARLWPRVRVA